MKGLFLLFALALAAIVVCDTTPAASRDLSFDERVHAQEAIERIAYSHRTDTTRPFEEVYPPPLLEQKVRTYLKQSVALETIWGRPVTPTMLRRETERIIRQTRMRERLQELFAALGNDPLLIQDCLARRTLVDRLARTSYAHDDALHANKRQTAEALHADLLEGIVDPYAPHPHRTESTIAVQGGDPAKDQKGDPIDNSVLELDRHSFTKMRVPVTQGEIGALHHMRDEFRVQVVLDEDSDRVTLATYSVRKRPWDDWWREISPGLDVLGVTAVADGELTLPEPRSMNEDDCDPLGTWDADGMDEYGPRFNHTAVWTGTEMILWGGNLLPSGERYDPATDTYSPVSRENAPLARRFHSAVWTGSEMIVWGGLDFDYDANLLQTGGRYDPVSDTWTATSLVDAPEPRYSHTAVWTGSAMVVWGPQRTGGVYRPDTDSWTATEITGAPTGRSEHAGVWTGTHMIIWGGYPFEAEVGTGAMFDPEQNVWTEVPNRSAPSARTAHTAVWTGNEMIVWGGQHSGAVLETGGRFNPATGTWTPTNGGSSNPLGRRYHTAVWTGSEMLIWGGVSSTGSYIDTAGRYNPASDTWVPMSTASFSTGRIDHTAVSTGTHMIIYGGQGNDIPGGSGARYDWTTDSWTPMSQAGVMEPRYLTPAVWTGSEMLVWGGQGGLGSWFDTGGLYDPVTNNWTLMGTPNTPEGRSKHTAVWTGERMVIWGGSRESSSLNTGGRYVVALNGWLPTSTVGAPEPRYLHTAVWTGSEMIVFGGTPTAPALLGKRYDPATNLWSHISTAGAPAARHSHTAVWTGSEMIVWGGVGGGEYPSSGGRYDPTTNSWTATALADAPSGRRYHTAVWTGSEMIVWGGWTNTQGEINTGGRYDPQTGLWQSTSLLDAPSGRRDHVAVWADSMMIVWGGMYDTDRAAHRYDPLRNTWRPSGVDGAPIDRRNAAGVWTGSEMVVWFGHYTNHGGRYDPGVDSDCDGSPNTADCALLDSTVIAPPGEVSGVTYGADKLTLSWESTAPAAGSATVHDVTTGHLHELPVGALAEYCAAWGVDSDETAITTPTPPANQASWYLVRGRNLCGEGGYGQASDDAERISPGCP